MQLMIILQTIFVLEANGIGMNIQKVNKSLCEHRTTTKSSNHNKKLIFNDKETSDQTYILECIGKFYEILFKKRKQKSALEIKGFLRHLNIRKRSEDKPKLCEENLVEKDLYDSLKNMQNDKSPGKNGSTKEFYETFWNKLKKIFVDSVLETKEKGHLSKSGRQAIIKLIEKEKEIRDS